MFTAIRSRRGPRRRKPAKLHADKACDRADLRAWVRGRGIAARIACYKKLAKLTT